MDSENFILQQKVNFKGETEFRTKFGRHKALVFRKHMDFFYIDIYDNTPGKTGHIGLGFDELDALLTMRGHLSALKTCFMQQLNDSQTNEQTSPTTPPAVGFKQPTKSKPLYVVEKMPIHHASQPTKRSSRDVNMDVAKKPTVVYENISPVKKDDIPQDLVEYLYSPLFQD